MDVRLSGYVPPAGTVARRLWADGVYERAALEHALAWGGELERAWAECDRLELLLPIALARGAPLDRVTLVARGWILAARTALGDDLGWPPEDRALAAEILADAIAPDIDRAHLALLGMRAVERAGARAGGEHRYALLTACSELAQLGCKRSRNGFAASSNCEHLAAVLVAAVTPVDRALDLFSAPRDPEAFVREAITLARRELELDPRVRREANSA